MNDVLHLFQAFVAPAIFVSAISLLILSVNTRLMGIVSRLRQYSRARYDALRLEHLDEAQVYASQITSIERRAELIRESFMLSLMSLAGAITSCLLLGLGLYWKGSGAAAVAIFVVSMLCLLAATGCYIREVFSALTAVHDESRDPRFGAPPDTGGHHSL
jgi:hypothetical protein